MQPLQWNQKFLTQVSLCAPPDDVSRTKVLLYAALGIYVFVTLCLDFTSSSLFVIQYKKYDMEDILGSVLQTAAVSGVAFGMVSVFMLSKKLRTIFALYQTIYNECVHDESFRIFIRTEQLCVKLTRILVIKYIVGYIVLSVSLAIINVTYCHFKDNGIDPKCLYTPYKHILPWNDDTFAGWFYGLVCSFWMSGTYLCMNNIFLSFFLSTALNFHAFQQQYEALLSKINETTANNFESNSTKILHRAIRFHNLVKILFVEVSKVYAGVLFAQLLCGVTFIAASLFQMDMAIHHLDIYFYAYVNALTVSVVNLYLYCYGGATVTANCLKYSEIVCKIDWYLMPVDLQKYLILMIRSGHNTLVFSGYGIIKLNLESFTRILKSVMSFYLMMKTLTE